MSSENGIRLAVVTMILNIAIAIAAALGAYVLYDIHDRLVRVENILLKEGHNEAIHPAVSSADDVRR